MIGRVSLLGFVAASGVVHMLPSLPALSMRLGIAAVALLISLAVLWVFRPRGRP